MSCIFIIVETSEPRHQRSTLWKGSKYGSIFLPLMIFNVSDKLIGRKVLDERAEKFDFRNNTWNSRIVIYAGDADELRSTFIHTTKLVRFSLHFWPFVTKFEICAFCTYNVYALKPLRVNGYFARRKIVFFLHQLCIWSPFEQFVRQYVRIFEFRENILKRLHVNRHVLFDLSILFSAA